MNFHGKDIKIFTGSSNVDVLRAVLVCLSAKVTAHSFQTEKSQFLCMNLFAEATALLFSQLVHP